MGGAVAHTELPSEAAQRLESSLAPLTARVRAAVDETRSLIRLRDALLPGLMAGEIRVRDAGAGGGGGDLTRRASR